MATFTIHQAKKNLSRLIQRVAAGEEVIIARGAKPVARLVAIGDRKGKRVPGLLKGKLVVNPEFFEQLPESELVRWDSFP
jgi:prevent-host-death family protein